MDILNISPVNVGHKQKTGKKMVNGNVIHLNILIAYIRQWVRKIGQTTGHTANKGLAYIINVGHSQRWVTHNVREVVVVDQPIAHSIRTDTKTYNNYIG